MQTARGNKKVPFPFLANSFRQNLTLTRSLRLLYFLSMRIAKEKNHTYVVRERPPQARTQSSNRQRCKGTIHTVSGYFSD